MEDEKKYTGIIAGAIIVPLIIVFALLAGLVFLFLQDGPDDAAADAPPLAGDDEKGAAAEAEAGHPPPGNQPPEPAPEELEAPLDEWEAEQARIAEEFAEFRASLTDEEYEEWNEARWPESIWPREEDYAPMYPEFAEYLVWYGESKGTGGHGVGVWAVVNEGEDGNVYAYEKPSFSSEIIGDVRHSSSDLWWEVQEFYQTDVELIYVIYYATNEGTGWGLYHSPYDGRVGWIATEQVQRHRI